jgi:hypothetical protein
MIVYKNFQPTVIRYNYWRENVKNLFLFQLFHQSVYNWFFVILSVE